MNIKLNNILLVIVLTTGLIACGGGSSGSGSGSGALTLPKEISWIPPTQNTDGGLLTDLSHYRLYYGPDSNSLAWVFDIDTIGSTITLHTISSAQKDLLNNLVKNNSIHFLALTAVNTQNIESAFSNLVEFK